MINPGKDSNGILGPHIFPSGKCAPPPYLPPSAVPPPLPLMTPQSSSLFAFRLMREITRCEWACLKGDDPEAPKLMEAELKNAKYTLCPL